MSGAAGGGVAARRGAAGFAGRCAAGRAGAAGPERNWKVVPQRGPARPPVRRGRGGVRGRRGGGEGARGRVGAVRGGGASPPPPPPAAWGGGGGGAGGGPSLCRLHPLTPTPLPRVRGRGAFEL